MYKFTAELIRLVKMHPILYDFTLNDYRNTKMKNQIWENIGRSLEVSGKFFVLVEIYKVYMFIST